MSCVASLSNVFINPFYHGAELVESGVNNFQFDRVTSVKQIALGILLCIPIINALALFILQSFGYLLKTREELDQAYLHQKLEGHALVLNPLTATEEAELVYNQRKTDALRELQRLEGANWTQYTLASEIAEYDLDAILAPFSSDHNPERLIELAAFAEFQDTASLKDRLTIHRGGTSYQTACIKKHLSKLFDFFNRIRMDKLTSSQADHLKATIRHTFNQLIDAYGDCIDQVLVQVESIVIDVIVSYAEANQSTREGRVCRGIAFALFKYRCELIRHLCVTLYPNYSHMADLEREAKKAIGPYAGLQGEIIGVGAIPLFGLDDKISPIFQRFQSEYKPIQALQTGLLTYYGIFPFARNELFLWLREHYNFEDDTPLTTDLINALSDNPSLSVEDGGDLKLHALLFLLNKLNILQKLRV